MIMFVLILVLLAGIDIGVAIALYVLRDRKE